jgi:hypothetical protein
LLLRNGNDAKKAFQHNVSEAELIRTATEIRVSAHLQFKEGFDFSSDTLENFFLGLVFATRSKDVPMMIVRQSMLGDGDKNLPGVRYLLLKKSSETLNSSIMRRKLIKFIVARLRSQVAIASETYRTNIPPQRSEELHRAF